MKANQYVRQHCINEIAVKSAALSLSYIGLNIICVRNHHHIQNKSQKLNAHATLQDSLYLNFSIEIL